MSQPIALELEQPRLTFTASGGSVVTRTVHPSGVRILSEAVPGAHSTSIGLWVAVGSRDEDEVAYGSTHFLEHLLFKGTRTLSALDIAIAFDRVGGEHNALTAKEHTCYYAKVQDVDLEMAVGVLANMVADSLLHKDEFEVERQVILEELAMADDDPSDVAHERIAENVLGDHPLGRPIGGSPETIRASTRDAVDAHYRRYYRPDELVVTAAGALDHDRLVDWVITGLRNSGWDLGGSHAPTPRRDSTLAPIRREGSARVINKPLEQAVVALATPGLNASDPRRHALTVLSSVLGGGMSSRLFQEVREKRGLAYSVYSFQSSYADAGVFGMAAGTSPDNAEVVARVMLDQLRTLAESGITDEELERTRGNLRGASALALENMETRMVRLGRSELTTGEFLDRDAALARLDLVDLAQVQSLAQDIAGRGLSAVAVGPVPEESLASIVHSSDT